MSILSTGGRLKIVRGEDKDFVVKIRGKDSNDPVDLTAITQVSFSLTRSNRTLLTRTMAQVPAKKAFVDINNLRIIANSAGALGNNIILMFNGVDDLDTIVDEWNTANPFNTIAHNGLGTEVLSEAEYMLSGGADAYFPITVVGNPILGKIQIHLTDEDTKSLRLGLNQSLIVTLDFGAHPTGIRKITRYDNKVDILDYNPTFN
jgi:hypothetical protein